MSNIFEGLRVIDCGSFIAAPAAATVMSDFGADVIKIEPPGAGDPVSPPPACPATPKRPHNYGWLLDSRNKHSLALDLRRSPRRRRCCIAWSSSADVFITNYPLAGAQEARASATRSSQRSTSG